MNFSEQPPSTQWAALRFRGARFAEVWIKPEGQTLALTFRIPQKSFQTPGLAPRLTMENLLKAVGIPTEEVESWRPEGVSDAGTAGTDLELAKPLSRPPQDVTHLYLQVFMKPVPEAVVPHESSGQDIPLEKWQDLEARWKTILGIEAAMDMTRISMESLVGELETSLRKGLTADEKLNAVSIDVVQWTKAKNRVHYALPKAKEFIHRAIWALGTPERKKLDELFKNYIQHHIWFAEIDQIEDQFDSLQKDRQILSAQGVTVYQECRRVSGDVQSALRTLLNNAVANASRKKRAANAKGKFF